MKQLIKEAKRMQQLAGLLKEEAGPTGGLKIGDKVTFADPSSQEAQAVAKFIDDYVGEPTEPHYYVQVTFDGNEYNGEPSVALLASSGYIIYAAIPARLFKKIGHNAGIADDASEENVRVKSDIMGSSLVDFEEIMGRFS